ncbi:MAG: phosphate regulon transcriptional regulator PhoB [Alphaproteobacteria bacterium]
MTPLILIVEDEPPQVELLTYNLQSEGFRTIVAGDGEEALLLADETPPDLIVLDWMLPKMSGIEVCRRIRASKQTCDIPIIMLTARGEEEDRVRGLETGADDYMVKPYSQKEMVARIKAALRRHNASLLTDSLSYGGVVMNLETKKVSRDSKKIHLGPKEFGLLQTLMEHPSRVFSREQLLNKVWGRDVYVEDRTVDVHIRRLRKALNADGLPDTIRTVRGAGYAIDADKSE